MLKKANMYASCSLVVVLGGDNCLRATFEGPLNFHLNWPYDIILKLDWLLGT